MHKIKAGNMLSAFLFSSVVDSLSHIHGKLKRKKIYQLILHQLKEIIQIKIDSCYTDRNTDDGNLYTIHTIHTYPTKLYEIGS